MTPSGTAAGIDRKEGVVVAMQREAQTLVDAWANTFNAGNTAGLARFYSEDARVIPPGRSAVVGPQAICAFFADLQDQGFRDFAIDLGDVFAKDAFLVASGRWAIRRPGGPQQLYWGNSLNLLAPGPAGWLIAVHMWN